MMMEVDDDHDDDDDNNNNNIGCIGDNNNDDYYYGSGMVKESPYKKKEEQKDDEEEEVKLVEIGKNVPSMTVLMTRARNASETCSITLGPIEDSSSILPTFRVPLSNKPSLTCAQVLPCGHRFNAMALITHYATNAMSCPMCRGGLANTRINVRASFPGENWIKEFEARFPNARPSANQVSLFFYVFLLSSR